VHVQPAVRVHVASVINEIQFAELIQEETDARTRGTDHLSEHFLTHLRHDRLRLALLPKMGHEQLHPREARMVALVGLVPLRKTPDRADQQNKQDKPNHALLMLTEFSVSS
jgi:hypothetical protein